MPAIDALFDELLDRGGSDLHLSIGYPPLIRIHGRLRPLGDAPIEVEELGPMLEELLDSTGRRIFATRGDLEFAYAYGSRARFRVNYLMKTTGPGAVFHTVPLAIPSVEQLGLPPAAIRLAERPSGLIIVTGPTSSGKTTTVAALVAHINRSKPGHILTIEQPLEFIHTSIRCQISHREVGTDSPSMADAIRSAGRENADVVVIGDLRQPQTIRMALQLASDGILVLSTGYANSATDTIERIIHAFERPQQSAIQAMLADTLVGIVTQTLLQPLNSDRKVAAYEILVNNHAIASAIGQSEFSTIAHLVHHDEHDGMQSMDTALCRLVVSGTIDPKDAFHRAHDKPRFAALTGLSPTPSEFPR